MLGHRSCRVEKGGVSRRLAWNQCVFASQRPPHVFEWPSRGQPGCVAGLETWAQPPTAAILSPRVDKLNHRITFAFVWKKDILEGASRHQRRQ